MRALDLLASLGSYTADLLRVILDRQQFLLPELATFSLLPETARRIRYYTLLAPLGLGYGFAQLRGQPLSPDEARNQLFLAALTPLLDDAIDHHEADADSIRALLSAPNAAGQGIEAAMLALWQPIRATVPDVAAFRQAVLQTVEAQLASKRQFLAGLPLSEIHQLTFDKGGYAALLFRQALLPAPAPAEAAVWYQIGGMVQLLDDLFDVYEDTRMGISTLANTQPDAYEIQRQYEEGLRKMLAMCATLPYAPSAVRRFADKLLLLFVRGQVAASQLVDLQQRYGGDFLPATYQRKELITDMELMKNVHKAWVCYNNINI